MDKQDCLSGRQRCGARRAADGQRPARH
jgi:hypothetical protein